MRIHKLGMIKKGKNKKHDIREALKEYNLSKSAQTRKLLLDRKKDYKYFCRQKKQKFLIERGRKMNELRNKKPKEFWKIFRRKKPSPKHDISDDEFYQYFKRLTSESTDTINEQASDFMKNFDSSARETTFESMDEHITQAEIQKAINGLSSNKSCGADNILNEYFISAAHQDNKSV